MAKETFDFDIALSSAREDRARAEGIAALLAADGVLQFLPERSHFRSGNTLRALATDGIRASARVPYTPCRL